MTNHEDGFARLANLSSVPLETNRLKKQKTNLVSHTPIVSHCPDNLQTEKTSQNKENSLHLPTASELASGTAWLAKMMAYGFTGGLGGIAGGLLGGVGGAILGAGNGLGRGVNEGMKAAQKHTMGPFALIPIVLGAIGGTVGGLFKGAAEKGLEGILFGSGFGASIIDKLGHK